MSIATTDAKHVALFDTVTGIAFGPIFDDVPEADAFVRWFEQRGREARDLLSSNGYTQRDIANDWYTFRDYHVEAECPFDQDGYGDGPGWAGDADGEDGIARPYTCDCDCHKREGGVFSGR